MTHGKREDGTKSMREKRHDLVGRLALTVPEAAKAVGVSERHFRSMLPKIPHIYFGWRRRFRRVAIEDGSPFLEHSGLFRPRR
jgi:hypothetical protein